MAHIAHTLCKTTILRCEQTVARNLETDVPEELLHVFKWGVLGGLLFKKHTQRIGVDMYPMSQT